MYIRCIKTKIEGDDNSSYFNINDEFVVYGLLFSENGLFCLLDNGKKWQSTWFPMELFKIIDSQFPSDWYFNYVSQKFSIFSYRLLAIDNNHYENLFEHEKEDLAIFYTEKQKIDEWNKTLKYIIPLFEEKLSAILFNDAKELMHKFSITNIEFTGNSTFILDTIDGNYSGKYSINNERFEYLSANLTQVVELTNSIVLFFTENVFVSLYLEECG